MDTTDRRLIDALRANARATYAELAREVGLSAPAVHERVAKLEASGVITGYHAAISPAALGLSMTALISLNLSDNADVDVVGAGVATVPEVEDLWFVAGKESYVAKVRVRDIRGLELAMRAINGVPGVSASVTTVVVFTSFEGRAQPADVSVEDTAEAL